MIFLAAVLRKIHCGMGQAIVKAVRSYGNNSNGNGPLNQCYRRGYIREVNDSSNICGPERLCIVEEKFVKRRHNWDSSMSLVLLGQNYE